jgi:hypothetical protein
MFLGWDMDLRETGREMTGRKTLTWPRYAQA